MRAVWPCLATSSLSSLPPRRRRTNKNSHPSRALHDTRCCPRCALCCVSACPLCRCAEPSPLNLSPCAGPRCPPPTQCVAIKGTSSVYFVHASGSADRRSWSTHPGAAPRGVAGAPDHLGVAPRGVANFPDHRSCPAPPPHTGELRPLRRPPSSLRVGALDHVRQVYRAPWMLTVKTLP
jgi:hypothetical protein